MIRQCEICGKEYVAQRKTSRYCGDKCRQRAARGYNAGSGDSPSVTHQMSKRDIDRTIEQAHISAADLSRASMCATAPLCVALGNAAAKFEAALREENL
jgi:hypothetical protein